ncbi:MAG: sulfotransferase [Gammaproteobacteria bacterium]|nr:sulfotransferase [Gammaproteobacteria bacterium]
MTPLHRDILAFYYHAWRRGLGNFALLGQRDCVGQIASMHQSGTHWLKFMLANALAHHYGTPPPAYNHANDIIGGPRDAVVYPSLPRLISSHSMPHPCFTAAWAQRLWRLPSHVLLLRDLRDSLASNYAKWRARYAVDFSTYLRGDPAGRRYNSDLWWTLRFMNTWGDAWRAAPARFVVLRYEDLRADPRAALERVNAHFALGLGAADLEHGIAASDKRSMAARDDPARPPGAVRVDDGDSPTLSADDRAYIAAACRRCLRHDFGYDFGHR